MTERAGSAQQAGSFGRPQPGASYLSAEEPAVGLGSLAPSKWRRIASGRSAKLIGVLLFATLVYARSLGNGFVSDDAGMIVRNHYIGQWSFLWRSFVHDSWWFFNPLTLPMSSYYRPLQDVALALGFHLFGIRPLSWHAATLLLHVLIVWLVFKNAMALTARVESALLASILFAALPIHAEAVVWASAIPLLLVAAFELGSFYLFIGRGERIASPAALLLYALALWSHESAVVFPALIGAYVLLLERADHQTQARSHGLSTRVRQAVVCAGPFAAEAVAYLIVRFLVLGFITRPYPYNHYTNAEVILTIPRAILTYLVLLIGEWQAGPAHDVMPLRTPIFYASLFALLGLAFGLFALLRRHSRRDLYLFCAAWVAIAIAPMMNLGALQPGAAIQDRYLYLASFGFCTMLGDLAAGLAGSTARLKRTARWAIAAFVVFCTATLWRVQHYWSSDLVYFSRCVEASPQAAVWHHLFGALMTQRGDYSAALPELEKSVAMDPGDPLALFDLGIAYDNLGRRQDSLRLAEKSIQLSIHPPANVYVFQAHLYDWLGDREHAEALLKRAESMPGGKREVRLFRAQVAASTGDAETEARMYRQLASAQPDDYELWDKLGLALARSDRTEQALAAYQQATKLAPPDPAPYLHAAILLHELGRDREALAVCKSALRVAPSDAGVRTLADEIGANIAAHEGNAGK